MGLSGCLSMIKRVFDLLLASFSFFIMAPVLALVAFLVRINLGSPVIFHQNRPGLHGQPFKMFKFRTMLDVVDAKGNLLPDEARLTQFGKFLRATSLDEQPELWNVIKGDMSMVGPRPLLMEYLPLYNQEQFRRHDVRPGITGWAQINGRNTISWEEKFKLDTWYVDNQSFWLDIEILFLTIKKVFFREGINAKRAATMPLFRGDSKKGSV
jgi:lipopolysaccharide/colanic/teichoic acid biosynthesis glycosyltransferase